MSRSSRSILSAFVAFLLAGPAVAQTIDEVCPNPNGTGALWGLVSDLDAEMALPGATVLATWEIDGTPGRAETQTALDGSYTMCYVPIGTELSVHAALGTITGAAIAVTLEESIVRQDVGFSLTGAGTEESTGEDKIWACIGPPGSQIRVQLGSLVRCDTQWGSLDRCPREELERVQASGARGRGAMREMVDQLVDKAESLGANALVDFTGGRGSMEALAVRIEVDPATC